MISKTSRRYTISHDINDNEDDKFFFESIARYNPHAKAPILSPSNSLFPKNHGSLPMRFKLPKINNCNRNTKTRRRRSKSKNKRDKKIRKDEFDTTKTQYWKKNENLANLDYSDSDFQTYPIKSSSSHRSSSVPSNETKSSITDNHDYNYKHNHKFYKTLFIQDMITQDIKSDVKKEFKKMKTKNQDDNIIFTLKGTDKKPFLDIIKNEIEQVCDHYGYTLKTTNSGTVIECQKKSDEHISDSSSSSAHRTTLLVPCSTEENSLAAIKKRVLSLYNGIVTFKPIRKRYNTSSPVVFLNKIVDVCKENGYMAKITDIQNQIVECDMRTRIQNNNAATTTTTAATNSNNSVNNAKLKDRGCVNVDVPWNSPTKAESVIRSYLTDNSIKGKIRFAPSVGLYSVINMSNFPDKIVDICSNKFHFQAVKFPNQVVECNKSVKSLNSSTNLASSASNLSCSTSNLSSTTSNLSTLNSNLSNSTSNISNLTSKLSTLNSNLSSNLSSSSSNSSLSNSSLSNSSLSNSSVKLSTVNSTSNLSNSTLKLSSFNSNLNSTSSLTNLNSKLSNLASNLSQHSNISTLNSNYSNSTSKSSNALALNSKLSNLNSNLSNSTSKLSNTISFSSNSFNSSTNLSTNTRTIQDHEPKFDKFSLQLHHRLYQ